MASTRDWKYAPNDQFGPWVVIEPVGAGGFAEVYKAYHRATPQRLAAIKVLTRQADGPGMAKDRFRQEVALLARIDSPNVVKFFDADYLPDGQLWLAMEFLVGTPLDDLLKRVGKLEYSEALRIAAEVATGVQAAHAIGVVHRDIKAENVFITGNNVAKVLDFGISKLLDPGADRVVKSTAADLRIGTLYQMSPEQIKGHPTSFQTDVYTLGMLLYKMITGGYPYVSEDGEMPDFGVLPMRIIQQTPRPMSQFVEGVPADVESVVRTALAKHPDDRFASMTALRRAMLDARSRILRASGVPDAYEERTPGPPVPRHAEAPTSAIPSMYLAAGVTIQPEADAVGSRSAEVGATPLRAMAVNRTGPSRLPGVIAAVVTVISVLGLAGGVVAWDPPWARPLTSALFDRPVMPAAEPREEALSVSTGSPEPASQAAPASPTIAAVTAPSPSGIVPASEVVPPDATPSPPSQDRATSVGASTARATPVRPAASASARRPVSSSPPAPTSSGPTIVDPWATSWDDVRPTPAVSPAR